LKRIAVFGYNRLSMESISRLNVELYQVVVVGQDALQTGQAKADGLETADIDFRSDEDLKSLGIGDGRVRTILSFFEQDSENVFLTLSARALDKDLTIIAAVDNPEAAEKLLAAGANKIIDPYEICGRKIHDMLKRPDITDIFDHTVFGRHDLHLAEIVIPEHSFLLDGRVNHLEAMARYNLILIGVVNKQVSDDIHFIATEHCRRLSAGDILVILGPSREINAFKQYVEDES
jgi:voltage-gated potassium channel